ncbi:MAG TPA: hypothetical protein VIJ93_14235, partial [bacterium]
MAKKSDKPGKFGLYFFGLGEIFIGCLFVLLSLLMLVMPKFIPANSQVPMPNMWSMSLLYFVMASCIIALGVGTLLAKRWARKIMLILSWYGLCAGLIGMVFIIFFMGSFLDNSLNASGKLTPDVIAGMKIGIMVAMSFFYFVLPGIFILFYRSQYVLSAVEFYDPKEN